MKDFLNNMAGAFAFAVVCGLGTLIFFFPFWAFSVVFDYIFARTDSGFLGFAGALSAFVFIVGAGVSLYCLFDNEEKKQ